jgi:hypothetical protein
MTLRHYLFLIGLSTALCLLGFAAVVLTVDPAGVGAFGYVLFYATLGLSLVGLFSVIGLVGRALMRRDTPAARHVSTSFRQALLLCLLTLGSLLLQSRSLLTWWNLLLFLATLVILEFFLTSFRPQRG